MKYIEQPKRVVLRVIPHKSVLNSGNRRLWRVLHDLLMVRDAPLSRIHDGAYHMPDDVWWVVAMRKGAVEFFIALPDNFGDVFSIKLRNHEQWSKCTIREDALTVPAGDVYALKYERSDMFSLTCDYARQTTPIRDLLQTVNELEDGDTATLLIRLEAAGRRWWQSRGDYLWDAWQKGGVPQRPGFSLAKLKDGVGRTLSGVVGEGQSTIVNVLEGVEQSFFGGHADTGDGRREYVDPERQAILINGSLSTSTTSKRNLPVFKVGMYCVVNAPTEARRKMLAHSMCSSFGELAGDNRLVAIKQNSGRIAAITKLESPLFEIAPNMMSTDEVGRIIQLPTAEVQDEFADVLEVNRRVEIELPAPFRHGGIFAGTATLKGEEFPVYIPTENPDMTMTSRAFIGSPRMGKDQAAINLVVESCLKHGISSVIPDAIDERQGHRGMADAVRDHLPPEKVIDINLGDFDWPVGLSLDGISSSTNERILANRLAQELVGFFMGDSPENYQTREYLREAAKAVRGDLLGIRSMLLDPRYREWKIAQLRQAGRDTTLLEEYHGLTEARQSQIAGPVLIRLGEILGDEALRPIFCQRSKLELGRWMEEGKVIIFRIPSRDLGELAVKTLVHWIVLVVFLTKLSRGNGGTPTWLILNEPHQYVSDGFLHFCKRMLVEGPKYHIAPVLIFHHFKLLPDPFVDVLLSASLNWHIFKNTNDNVYQRLKNYLAPTFAPEEAMAATPAYSFIASWLAPNGEYQPAFVVRCPDLVGKRYPTADNSFLTARHSRMYGRNIIEVEKGILSHARMTVGERNGKGGR